MIQTLQINTSSKTNQHNTFKAVLKYSMALLLLLSINIQANAQSQCPIECSTDDCNEIVIEYEVTVPSNFCTPATTGFFVNFDDDFCEDGAEEKFSNSVLVSTLPNGDRIYTTTVTHDRAEASTAVIQFIAGSLGTFCNGQPQLFSINAADSYAKVTYTHGTSNSATYTSVTGPTTFDLNFSITYPPNLSCTGTTTETVLPFIGFTGNSWCEGIAPFPLSTTWQYDPSTGGTYTGTVTLLQPCASGPIDFSVGLAQTSTGADCFSGLYTIDINSGEDFGLLEIEFVNGGANSTINYTPSGALPVELTTFEAQSREENIHLSWETASELSNDYFLVEYSIDGDNFKEVGKVMGQGTTISSNSYGFIHQAPIAKVNYYRLKQVDYDGKFEYSNIIAVDMVVNNHIKIVPTLANDLIQIQYEGEEANVIIFNLNGQKVYQERKNFENGFQEVNVNDLPNGIYFLNVIDQKNVQLKGARFIKQ